MTVRHFLELAAIDGDALRAILAEAHRRKRLRQNLPRGAADPDAPLAGHTLAMVFEKPSTRTRVSFDMAMRQLGGSAIVLSAADLQLGHGETVADTARVLSRYVDAVMIRAKRHADVVEFAANAEVPVLNGLTEHNHPTQAMADVMTAEERLGRPVEATRWAWVGDGNNMARSLIAAARQLRFDLKLACPVGYAPDTALIYDEALAGRAELLTSPGQAVSGADVVATDVWFSMGDLRTEAKAAALAPYRVTAELMSHAAPHAVFLHCLPAHRGEEVLEAVIDGPMSAVWDEAENRLHVQKAILLWTLNRLG